MAKTNAKLPCSICNKEKNTYKCSGCSENFCFNHLHEHRQMVQKQFDDLENNHDQFKQRIIQERKHSLIENINQWEKDSIKTIQQLAQESREILIDYTNTILIELENKLLNVAKQIKSVREENEFNELDLNQFKQKLNKLEDELNRSLNISIKQQSTSFINKISVHLPFDKNTKWKENGITIVGETDHGHQISQLQYPRSIFIDDDQTFYITDWENHRIIEWKSNAKNARIVAGGNGQGNQMNQLNGPSDAVVDKENHFLIISDVGNRRIMRWSLKNNTKTGEILIDDINCWGLAMDKDGSLYVSDGKKNEVRRWKKGEKNGIIVAGGNKKGDKLNQLNVPGYIFVDEDHSLYISDQNNYRVMKWFKDAKEGIVVAGGNGKGNHLKQLSRPQGVIVDKLGQVFVADWDNHQVVCWCSGAREGIIIAGGNGPGKELNRFFNPQGLAFDRERNLYVVDCNNNRIQKFEIDCD